MAGRFYLRRRMGARLPPGLRSTTTASETARVADDLGSVRLILAVLRSERVPFDDAWLAAFPSSRRQRDRCDLRLALTETREAWERAYSNAPASAGESAAARMAALWNERDDGAEDRGELVGVRCG